MIQGDTVNDSHAEVIARRAFMHWIYDELCNAAQQAAINPSHSPQQPKGSAFIGQEDGLFHAAEDVTYHMYISQLPCGDACVYQSLQQMSCSSESKPFENHTSAMDTQPPETKRQRVKRRLTISQPGTW